MKNKLKAMFTNNLLLKILAVLFAVLLWLMMTNVQNAMETKTINVPITLSEEDITWLEEKGLCLTAYPDTIAIAVQVRHNDVKKITEADYEATFKLSRLAIGEAQVYEVPVHVEQKSGRQYSQSYTWANRSGAMVEITIEELDSRDFVIELATEEDTALPEGYSIASYQIDPQVVTISGPSSALKSIDAAKVVINLDDLPEGDSNPVVSASIRLFENGDQRVSRKDILNQLRWSVDKVEVSLQLIKEDQVSVRAEWTGDVPNGCRVNGVNLRPSRSVFDVVGSKDELAALEPIVLTVEVDGKTESFEQEYDLREYLPEGVSLADESQAIVTVAVVIEQQQVRSFEIPTDIFEMTNKQDGLKYFFASGIVTIEVIGYASDLEQFNPSEHISGKVDVSGYKAGDHNVTIDAAATEGYRIKGTIRTMINVVDVRPTPPETPESTDPSEPTTNPDGSSTEPTPEPTSPDEPTSESSSDEESTGPEDVTDVPAAQGN